MVTFYDMENNYRVSKEEWETLIRVVRAAEKAVERDKEQFDRLIVMLALEDALEALPEHLRSEDA